MRPSVSSNQTTGSGTLPKTGLPTSEASRTPTGSPSPMLSLARCNAGKPMRPPALPSVSHRKQSDRSTCPGGDSCVVLPQIDRSFLALLNDRSVGREEAETSNPGQCLSRPGHVDEQGEMPGKRPKSCGIAKRPWYCFRPEYNRKGRTSRTIRKIQDRAKS